MASAPVEIPHRPSGVYPATDLMNIDGFFVVNMGRQHVQLTLRNVGADLDGVSVYLEGFSDPGVSFAPRRLDVGWLPAGAELPVRFTADFTNAAPDASFVSFVVEADGHQLRRIVKKIFVTRVDYHKPSKTYTVKTPQGDMAIVVHRALMGPEEGRCRDGEAFTVLFQDVSYTLRPKPSYEGVRGPLMYEDPWWKLALLILAGLVALGAALYDYFSDGTLDGGSVSVGGTFEETGPSVCCTKVSTSASKDEKDYLAKGLYGAAGAIATAGIASDDPDLHWRGQEATEPAAGELTVGERVRLQIDYVEAPSPGVPYAIEGEWAYTRETDAGGTYVHEARDRRENIHVLERYEVEAPSAHDRASGPLVVSARFVKIGGDLCRGGELLVTGHLISDHGQYRQFQLTDAGLDPDAEPNDGVYTGAYRFSRDAGEKGDPSGNWYLFVVAQDVNTVAEGTDPFEAAHTVGGMVLTTQLQLGIDKPCELNHDAVIAVV